VTSDITVWRTCPYRSSNWGLASLFFYAWGEVFYAVIILVSIGINYTMAKIMADIPSGGHKRSLLLITVGLNLALLGWFKYANFLVDNVNVVLCFCDGPTIHLEPIHLPIGISFSISPAIRIWRLAWGVCWGLLLRKISTPRILLRRFVSSGSDGIYRCPHGSGIICIFPWGAAHSGLCVLAIGWSSYVKLIWSVSDAIPGRRDGPNATLVDNRRTCFEYGGAVMSILILSIMHIAVGTYNLLI
jgi:hypothetical protein